MSGGQIRLAMAATAVILAAACAAPIQSTKRVPSVGSYGATLSPSDPVQSVLSSTKNVPSVPSYQPVLGPPTPVESVLSSTKHVQTIHGVASWYDATKNHAWYTRESKWGPSIKYYAAAGPAARALIGDDNPYHEHYHVDVTNRLNGRRIRVTIVDWCGCSSGHKGEKAIDLSPAAFHALGIELSRGIAPVTISLLP